MRTASRSSMRESCSPTQSVATPQSGPESRGAAQKSRARVQSAHGCGHRRQADGRVYVAARDGASQGQALLDPDRSQRDSGNRSDGRREPQEPGRNHGANRLRSQRGPAANSATNFERLRRQPRRLDWIFYVGIFGDVGGAGNPAGSPSCATSRSTRKSRWLAPIAWGCTVQRRACAISPKKKSARRATSASSPRAALTRSTSACRLPTHGINVNKAASIGNVLVLEAADYIDLMAADPATRVIGMYIEGVRDGRRFFDSVRHAAERHPVVIWKGGVTEAGARATFSHTGSLATARGDLAHSSAAEWRGRSGEPRRDARRGRAIRASQASRRAAGWAWSR